MNIYAKQTIETWNTTARRLLSCTNRSRTVADRIKRVECDGTAQYSPGSMHLFFRRPSHETHTRSAYGQVSAAVTVVCSASLEPKVGQELYTHFFCECTNDACHVI